MFLNGTCLRSSANFLIDGIKKNWPIKKNICKKSKDFGENLKVKIKAIIARKAKKILDDCIHFQLNDMQIVEDLQMFVCHVCCKWLSKINLAKNK